MTTLKEMIKQTVAALAALPFLAAPALAGPYVNIESNSGFTGSDYSSTTLENHLGYENGLGEDAAWYIQAGPAIVMNDGEDATTELSGKVGLSVAASERLDVYGEVSAITTEEIDFDEDFGVGVKLGVKYAL